MIQVWQPADVAKLNSSELLTPKVFELVKAMVIEYLNTREFDECKKLSGILGKKIREAGIDKISPEYSSRYQELLRLLEIGQVRFFDAAKKASYFRSSILLLIRYGLDPQEIFDVGLILADTLGDDDKLTLKSAFEKNQERLGKEPLHIQGYTNPVAPTLENWLLDFRTLIAKQGVEAVEGYSRAYYYNNSRNFTQLPEREQAVLRKVIDFYVWLQKPLPLTLQVSPRRPTPVSVAQVSTKKLLSQLPPPPPKPAAKPQDLSRPAGTLPRPGEGKKEEDLYRSTLEELQKMRETYEVKSKIKDQKSEIPPAPPPPPLPSRKASESKAKPLIPSTPSYSPLPPEADKSHGGETKERKPFSINEALIHGDYPGSEEPGGVGAGQEIEEKLRKLESKAEAEETQEDE